MRVLLTLLMTLALATAVEAAPWARRGGGSLSDVAQAVVVDPAGNTIVTGGFTGSANFGGGPLTSAGWGDVILAKYTPAGALLWSKRLGGTNEDRGYGVAIDPRADCDGAGGTNCIVLAGVFRTTGYFGGTALVSAGNGDIFVAKYGPTGTHLWSHGFGSTGEDTAYGVAVDASGNVLVTGAFFDTINFGGGVLSSPNHDLDLFLAKFSSTGTHVWSKNYTNTSVDIGRAIALDSQGNVALAGSFMGGLNFGTTTVSSHGYEDVLVAKFSGTDGSAVWAKRFGASYSDIGYGVAVDSGDNVLLTGSFQFTVDFGGGSQTAAGTDIFMGKYAGTDGAHIWSRTCTGSYNDQKRGASIAADGSDNVVVSGEFAGGVDFGTGTKTAIGPKDIFVAKYTAAGVPVWSEQIGSVGGTNSGNGIAADPTSDDILATGSFQGRANINGQTLNSAGAGDVFLLRLAP